jgi:hypothetical protein
MHGLQDRGGPVAGETGNERCEAHQSPHFRGPIRDPIIGTRMEFTGMQRSRLAYAVAGVALLAGTYSLPAAADDQNSYIHHRYIHHRIVHRAHPPAGDNDVYVRRGAEPVAAAPDAFHGPAAIITAPIAIAGTIVSLPFRLVEAVFPPRANDPRVLIGAPVYVAGEIAEFPFVAVNSIFGVQPTNYF